MYHSSKSVILNKNKGEKIKHCVFKILIIGDMGTGKSSIISQYVHKSFTQQYNCTLPLNFEYKIFHYRDNKIIRLQIWDMAGQERNIELTKSYYNNADAAIVVYDVTREETFENVTKWKSELDSVVQYPDGTPIPCIILANKCDKLKTDGLLLVTGAEKMRQYCKNKGFASWHETSALKNINIDKAMECLVDEIIERQCSIINHVSSVNNKTDNKELQDENHQTRNKVSKYSSWFKSCIKCKS